MADDEIFEKYQEALKENKEILERSNAICETYVKEIDSLQEENAELEQTIEDLKEELRQERLKKSVTKVSSSPKEEEKEDEKQPSIPKVIADYKEKRGEVNPITTFDYRF